MATRPRSHLAWSQGDDGLDVLAVLAALLQVATTNSAPRTGPVPGRDSMISSLTSDLSGQITSRAASRWRRSGHST